MTYAPRERAFLGSSPGPAVVVRAHGKAPARGGVRIARGERRPLLEPFECGMFTSEDILLRHLL